MLRTGSVYIGEEWLRTMKLKRELQGAIQDKNHGDHGQTSLREKEISMELRKKSEVFYVYRQKLISRHESDTINSGIYCKHTSLNIFGMR